VPVAISAPKPLKASDGHEAGSVGSLHSRFAEYYSQHRRGGGSAPGANRPGPQSESAVVSPLLAPVPQRIAGACNSACGQGSRWPWHPRYAHAVVDSADLGQSRAERYERILRACRARRRAQQIDRARPATPRPFHFEGCRPTRSTAPVWEYIPGRLAWKLRSGAAQKPRRRCWRLAEKGWA
jgi:hypothetical protein